jgi:hypothetical protein
VRLGEIDYRFPLGIHVLSEQIVTDEVRFNEFQVGPGSEFVVSLCLRIMALCAFACQTNV